MDKQVLARPNVKMFSDHSWVDRRTREQEERMHSWLSEVGSDPLVVIEIGSGKFVPTVRAKGEGIVELHSNSCLIRINPLECEVDNRLRGISLPMKGLEALLKIGACLNNE